MFVWPLLTFIWWPTSNCIYTIWRVDSRIIYGCHYCWISFFIQTGTVTSEVILLSIPSSILIGAILLANNIRDLDGDKENGRKTLAILVGRERAVGVLASMFIVSLHLDNCFNYRGHRITMDAYRILSAPKAFKATKGFIGKSIPMEMVPAMIATAKQIQSSVS